MQTIGIFRGEDTVRCVAEALRDVEIDPARLSLLIREASGDGEIRPEATVSAGVAHSTVHGTVIGGLAGLVAGGATALTPELGLIVAAGPIATGLSALAVALLGGASGAAVGTLVGLVSKLGVPEEDAHEYAGALRQEGLMALEHDGSHDVAAIFRRCGCRRVRNYG